MKLLVTGAGGFIPSHICDALLEDGHKVIGIVHSKEDRIKHLSDNDNFRIEKGDINDLDFVNKILNENNIECIIHSAALHSPKELDDPFPYFSANSMGTLSILEAAKGANIKKIIYSSTMGVYGNKPEYLPVNENHPLKPFNFYSATKLQGEMFCKLYSEMYGFNVIILRYSGVFGTRRFWGGIYHFVKNAIENRQIIVSKDIKWDTIYVKDVGEANVLALKKINEIKFDIFNIGRGKLISTMEIADMIAKISNSKYSPKLEGEKEDFEFFFDIKKAKELLGFEPKSLEESLKDYIRNFINYESSNSSA